MSFIPIIGAASLKTQVLAAGDQYGIQRVNGVLLKLTILYCAHTLIINHYSYLNFDFSDLIIKTKCKKLQGNNKRS